MDLKVLSMASALARHAAERHSVIAENIANADTPGYLAKDLKPFAETPAAQAERGGFAPHATRAGHVTTEFGSNVAQAAFDVAKAEAHSPNGNSVSLEGEMVKSASAQGQHDLALTIYRKSLDILRLGLGRAR